jgi:hypothetical protein
MGTPDVAVGMFIEGIGFIAVPAVVVLYAVIWAIKGLGAAGRSASAAIDRKRNEQD